MLEERNPEMKRAVGILKELSEDERTRMLFEEREKARRDIASMISGARREEREYFLSLLKQGLSTEEIQQRLGE